MIAEPKHPRPFRRSRPAPPGTPADRAAWTCRRLSFHDLSRGWAMRSQGLCASEGGATAADANAHPFRTSLAALLTGHILRDGEVVQLILKPSLWFILFSSMRLAAIVLIVTIAAKLWFLPQRAFLSFAYAAAFVLAGRVMWAVLQWMGRLYVLTDMRVVRLSGVFNVEIFDCALRKVAATRVTRTFREKLWRLGSIEIIPVDDSCPPGVWQTVKRPGEVQAKLQSTIDRAKQGSIP